MSELRIKNRSERAAKISFTSIVHYYYITKWMFRKFLFVSQGAEEVVNFAGMTEDYPRFPDIHDLHYNPEDGDKIMVGG